MNPQDIFTKVILSLKCTLYRDRLHEFYRDHEALLKAVARYCAECHQRGWDLEPAVICAEIMRVVERVLPYRDEAPYLPAYLERAIANHVAYRAEDIQKLAQATKTARTVHMVMDGTERVARVEPTTTELVSKLYESLVVKRRKKRLEAHAPKPVQQLSLL